MAAASDFFKQLSAGVRFDRKRPESQVARPQSASQGDASQAHVIDFFNETVRQSVPESKSRTHDAGLRLGSKISDEELEESAQIGDISVFRKAMRINVKGESIADPVGRFSDLQLNPAVQRWMLANIEDMRWKEPTPIQMQAVPCLLQGRNVIACAPTGSGKTAAFVLPMLALLKESQPSGFRALIVTPTRELAKQIHTEILLLGGQRRFKTMLLTKANFSTLSHETERNDAMRHDILITTPQRLVALIEKGGVDLSTVQHLIIDEADRLFDDGFVEQLDAIVSPAFLLCTSFDLPCDIYPHVLACSRTSLQKALFSATVPQKTLEIVDSIMDNAVHITIGARLATASNIDQKLVYCGNEEGKLVAIRTLLQTSCRPPVLIFVQSKERAQELFQELLYEGVNVDVIHADRPQGKRDEVVRNFRQGITWVLICTDLMGRGIDFKGVNLVINYDFPQSVISYIHRIGRTGRAGKNGAAITYFTQEDKPMLRSIANVIKESGCEVPSWMLELKKISSRDRRQLKSIPIKRHRIDTRSSYDQRKQRNRQQLIDSTKSK